MDMTNQEYGAYVNSKSKPSPLWKNLCWAFVVGGLICTAGQGLLEAFKRERSLRGSVLRRKPYSI